MISPISSDSDRPTRPSALLRSASLTPRFFPTCHTDPCPHCVKTPSPIRQADPSCWSDLLARRARAAFNYPVDPRAIVGVYKRRDAAAEGRGACERPSNSAADHGDADHGAADHGAADSASDSSASGSLASDSLASDGSGPTITPTISWRDVIPLLASTSAPASPPSKSASPNASGRQRSSTGHWPLRSSFLESPEIESVGGGSQACADYLFRTSAPQWIQTYFHAAVYKGKRLGGDRAVRCEQSLPVAPFSALYAVEPEAAATSGAAPYAPSVAAIADALGSEATTSSSDQPESGGEEGWGEGDEGDEASSSSWASFEDVMSEHDDLEGRAVEVAALGSICQMAVAAQAIPRTFVIAHECLIGYFEVTVGAPILTDLSGLDCVAIGLCSARFPLSGRQPGWDKFSFGYHSDDGHIFHGSGNGARPFGPRFGDGDVVGCGISIRSRRIFFTKNGEFIGAPFVAKPNQLPLHPVVGLDTHAPVYFNLGQAPFRFDLRKAPEEIHSVRTSVSALRHTLGLTAALQCLIRFN